jgi:hypothetical protein
MTAHTSTAAAVLSRRALLLTVGAPKTPSMRCFTSYTVHIRIEGSRIPHTSKSGVTRDQPGRDAGVPIGLVGQALPRAWGAED